MLHDERVRVDAQRNRDRILEAARALVAETGVDATMEDIARHAGVAVGTLYRHFPAKEDLVAAVVEDSLAQMASLTEGALAAVHAGAAPGPALGELFREIAERTLVSANTVKAHKRAIYQKLGADNRRDIVARARREGLLVGSE